MKNLVKSIAVASLALVGFQAAASANLSNFYVAGNGAVAFQRDMELSRTNATSLDADTKVGYGASLAVGYIIEQFRVEVEALHRHNKIKVAEKADAQVNGQDKSFYKQTALMLNGFYDLPVYENLDVYFGLGLGVAKAQLKLRDPEMDSHATFDDTVFAYQAMTGLAYHINDQWTATLGYRFFATTKPSFRAAFPGEADKMPISNNIEAGLRFRF